MLSNSKKNHLQSVGLTYSEHFFRAYHIGQILFIGALKCFVHAICPDVWTNAYKDTIESLSYNGYNIRTEQTEKDE